jgi:putative nucleotidyltransferase with HDIG domain/diguanylate cyclase (GGDEF)-like protein
MVEIKELKKLTSDFTVLYVEDDLSIQTTMSKYLQKFFASVYNASNGVEGLALFKENLTDIVITDLSMPVMNGLDMIEKIKEIKEDQAIIITTAHSESTYLLGAIQAHVDGYVVKPFEFDALNFELFKISQKLHKFKENEEYKNHLQELLKAQTLKINENYEKTLYSMVELIEQRDTYTAGHSKRVAHYSEMIAREMGYSEEECIKIHQAGILHDLGKIETPDSILLNPSKLNEIEYKLIQEHVSVSYKLLRSIPMFEPLAKIVYQHHEHYDGSGYPNGCKSDEIEPLAHILIVTDAFDAMTTNRIYKSKKSINEAIEELNELSKKQFHPDVIKVASKILKDIEIDENINQLPQSKLEEERFAYFYSDRLSGAYNHNYLEIVLMKNHHESYLKNMLVFSINSFSSYNKLYGWSEGDKILQEFAKILIKMIDNVLVFRIFGDDFIVLSEKKINYFWAIESLNTFMKEKSMSYKMHDINLKEKNIANLRDIEKEYLSE